MCALCRHAEFFTDLSFVDYDFVSYRSSSIALAAGICSFQQMNIEHCVWSRAAMSIHAFDTVAACPSPPCLPCSLLNAQRSPTVGSLDATSHCVDCVRLSG